MTSPTPSGFLRRAALGLWFCAIAVVGLLQFYARAFDGAQFAPPFVAWIWLAGGVVLGLLGSVLILRALRKPL